ncbi:hypothetical protein M5K25_027089 [Dendrobium thyrsiflorum]|uniref:Uncharacterized protein n=1 Tax=Dendrobium thyrsiflorum TaxID=117978 RepID=A0ABD0TZE6_DENTH
MHNKILKLYHPILENPLADSVILCFIKETHSLYCFIFPHESHQIRQIINLGVEEDPGHKI